MFDEVSGDNRVWRGLRNFGEKLGVVKRKELSTTPEYLKAPYDRVTVIGDAALAAAFNRGRDKVKEIQICAQVWGSNNVVEEGMTHQLENWKAIKPVLTEDQYRLWEKWIQGNGYEKLPISFIPSGDVNQTNMLTPYINQAGMLLMDIGGKAESVDPLDLKVWKDYSPDEVLEPRQTIKDTLKCLEIGDKFGLKVDTDVLDEAESQTRSGIMALRVPSISFILTADRFINPELDQETVDQLMKNHPEVLGRFPKLRKLCEQIQNGGGVEPFIRKNYGQMYLEIKGFRHDTDLWPGRIRLYYPKLASSPTTGVDQREAVENFYRFSEKRPMFSYEGVKNERIGEVQVLPVSDELRVLVDTKRLGTVVKSRALGDVLGLTGTYEVGYKSKKIEASSELKKIMEPLLVVMGIDSQDFWNKGSPKLSRKLASILDTRNPVFNGLDYSESGLVEIRISDDPMDIMQASTEKPWTSCTNLKGGVNASKLYVDVAAGTEIAYVMKDGKPVGRCLLREVRMEDGHKGVHIERYYGDKRFFQVMISAIVDVAKNKGLELGEKSRTNRRYKGAYSDTGMVSGSGRIYYGYTEEEMMEMESKETLFRRLVGVLKKFGESKRENQMAFSTGYLKKL